MKRMSKILFGLLTLLPLSGVAQQLTYQMPRDANNHTYEGAGNPYAFVLTPTTASYSALVQYQLPKTGLDTNRAYRHIYVRNPSTDRTVYICFGSATACTVDALILAPQMAIVMEPLRFGDPVGFPYVWAKLDSVGSVAIDLAVW